MVMMVEAMRDLHALPVEIDRLDFSRKKHHPLEKFADRVDDVRQIKITGCDFVQHGGEQKEIVAVHQGNLNIRIASQSFVQVHGCV